MPQKTVRAVGTAVLGPLRWAHRTGYWRSALSAKAVDRRGQPLPWYCLSAVDFLEAMDFTSDSVLEFGSGQSTLWWASKAAEVVGIEENEEWHSYVQKSLAGTANATVHLATDLDRHAALPLAWQRTFDVVVIDGGDRKQCAPTALRVIKPDGLIILDNSDGYWGPQGTYPILDLLEAEGWARVDFHGYAPGVLTTSVTSLFFRDLKRMRGLPPPRRGGQ